MSPKTLAAYVRFRTKTNSTTFSDTDLTLLLGVHIDELAKRILLANEDYFGMPQTTDLVADQREYPMPTDKLSSIKFVEVKLDGTNWIPLKEFDLASYTRTTDETAITDNFANEEGRAFYDIFRKSLWIYSGTITDVIGGIKLWTFTWPHHFTDLTSETDMSIDPTTTAHGFPREFHKILADLIIVDWKQSGDKQIALSENEQNIEDRIQKALDTIRSANQTRVVTAILPSETDRGDEGYEY
jgi:hypothetical protein